MEQNKTTFASMGALLKAGFERNNNPTMVPEAPVVEAPKPVAAPATKKPQPSPKPAPAKQAPAVPKRSASSPAARVFFLTKPAMQKSTVKDKKQNCLFVYLSPEEKALLQSASAQMRLSMSELAGGSGLDAVRNSYVCNEADCGCEFILRRTITDTPTTAKCCPSCGSANLSKLEV